MMDLTDIHLKFKLRFSFQNSQMVLWRVMWQNQTRIYSDWLTSEMLTDFWKASKTPAAEDLQERTMQGQQHKTKCGVIIEKIPAQIMPIKVAKTRTRVAITVKEFKKPKQQLANTNSVQNSIAFLNSKKNYKELKTK
jgi:hypothetical protein